MEVVGRRVEGLRAATAIFVGSRIGLVLIALVAMRYFPLNAYNRDHNSAYAIPRSETDRWREPPVAADQAPPPASSHAEPSWIAVWARWDALWYVRIAERGYAGRFGVDDLEGQIRGAAGDRLLSAHAASHAGSRLGRRFAAARGPLDLERISARVAVASFSDDAAPARRRGRRDRRRAAAAVSAGVLSLGPVLGLPGPRAFAGRARSGAGRPLGSGGGAGALVGADPADRACCSLPPSGFSGGSGGARVRHRRRRGARSPDSCRCSACSRSWATAAPPSATRSLRFTGKRPGAERWDGRPPFSRSSATGRGR